MSLRASFLKHIAQTSELPMMLEIERAEGVYLYDKDGKEYIDLISGISVSSLGHGDASVINAVKDQAEKYMHTMVYGEYIMSPQVQLAEELCKLLPPKLNSVYFVTSGSEAVEGAMKLARRVTGRREIISCSNAYHGSSHGSMSLMSDTYYTRAFRPLLPAIKHIEFNKEQDLRKITHKTAAVFTETIQAEAGVIKPENDYLKKLRDRCHETNTLLVFDEIQVGYGRTGSLFAFEKYGIVPDILLLAKAMGGGMPIGAFVSSKKLLDQFTHDPMLGHITTFGGHPVICAAGLATLQKLTTTDLITKVEQKSLLFAEKLKHPLIHEIRRAGFLMAVDLGSKDMLDRLIHHAVEQGVIVDWFLFNETSFRIAPPLIITNEEILLACEKLLFALDKVNEIE